jgi:hypothetical protein
MTWEQVLTLLSIAHMANDYPKLHNLRNVAIGTLEAIEPNDFHFASQEPGVPLGEYKEPEEE